MRVRLWLCSTIVVVYCLCSGGCQMDSGQRLALLESAVTQAQAAVQVATDNIAMLQVQLDAAKTAGADVAVVAKIQAALAEALARKPDVDTFLRNAQTALEKAKQNPNSGTEAETYVSIVVAALGLGLSAWFKRKVTNTADQLRVQKEGNLGLQEMVDEAAEQNGKTKRALETLVQVIDGLPADQQTGIKAEIAKLMAKRSDQNAVIAQAKENIRTTKLA